MEIVSGPPAYYGTCAHGCGCDGAYGPSARSMPDWICEPCHAGECTQNIIDLTEQIERDAEADKR